MTASVAGLGCWDACGCWAAQARIPAPLTFGHRTLVCVTDARAWIGLVLRIPRVGPARRQAPRHHGSPAGPPIPALLAAPKAWPLRWPWQQRVPAVRLPGDGAGAVATVRVSGAGERRASPAAALPQGLAPRGTAGRIPRLAPGGRVRAVPSSDAFLGPSPFSCPGPQSQPCEGLNAAN